MFEVLTALLFLGFVVRGDPRWHSLAKLTGKRSTIDVWFPEESVAHLITDALKTGVTAQEMFNVEYRLRTPTFDNVVPGAVVKIGREEDVVTVMKFINDKFVKSGKTIPDVRVRGCKHDTSGDAVVGPNGIVIDISALQIIRYDEAKDELLVQTGLKLSRLAHFAAVNGFGGVIPGAGLSASDCVLNTLGGGIGTSARYSGLAIDYITEARVVLATGQLVIANQKNKYKDLLWAIRGAGVRNFGIVTGIRMKTFHPSADMSDVKGVSMYHVAITYVYTKQNLDTVAVMWREFANKEQNKRERVFNLILGLGTKDAQISKEYMISLKGVVATNSALKGQAMVSALTTAIAIEPLTITQGFVDHNQKQFTAAEKKGKGHLEMRVGANFEKWIEDTNFINGGGLYGVDQAANGWYDAKNKGVSKGMDPYYVEHMGERKSLFAHGGIGFNRDKSTVFGETPRNSNSEERKWNLFEDTSMRCISQFAVTGDGDAVTDKDSFNKVLAAMTKTVDTLENYELRKEDKDVMKHVFKEEKREGLCFDEKGNSLVDENSCRATRAYPAAEMMLIPMGGTVSELDKDATAFAYRNAEYLWLTCFRFYASFQGAFDFAQVTLNELAAEKQGIFEGDVSGHTHKGRHKKKGNVPSAAQYFAYGDPVFADPRGYYGHHYDKLLTAKNKYDPKNLFNSPLGLLTEKALVYEMDNLKLYMSKKEKHTEKKKEKKRGEYRWDPINKDSDLKYAKAKKKPMAVDDTGYKSFQQNELEAFRAGNDYKLKTDGKYIRSDKAQYTPKQQYYSLGDSSGGDASGGRPTLGMWLVIGACFVIAYFLWSHWSHSKGRSDYALIDDRSERDNRNWWQLNP